MAIIPRLSFCYDGNPTHITCPGADSTAQLPGGLTVTTTVRRYAEYGAVEWVSWLENTSDAPTGLISALWDCDAVWPCPADEALPGLAWLPRADGVVRIFPTNGSNCGDDTLDFSMPADRSGSMDDYIHDLRGEGKTLRYASVGGRSSDGTAPYFELRRGEESCLVAIGWTGQWNAEFTRTAEGVAIRTGIEGVELRLLPGERIRTSSILMMTHTGTRDAAHNQWRRLMRAHVSPFCGADDPLPLCTGIWGGMPSEAALQRLRAMTEAQLPNEVVWMDAGWYGAASAPTPDEFEGDWPVHTGDWRVSRLTHPEGLLDVSRAIADSGRGFMLWFEPERISQKAPIRTEHPEYLIELPDNQNALLDLGNEAAWQYCFDTLCERIGELGLRIYRQDFNFRPLPYWDSRDAADRRGITQIKHVMGLYKLWDGLLERFPGLLIDNCASGGRRLDFEAMRRATPMWRSDMQCPANPCPETSQNHMLAFARWLPHSGTGTGRVWMDDYAFRSAYSASMTTNYTFSQRDAFGDDPERMAWLKRMCDEYVRVRPYFGCDFYPLTEESVSEGVWSACCFDRPEQGDGIVLAFRRAQSPFASATFDASWFRPGRAYVFTDADTGEETRLSGDELLAEGLTLAIPGRRQSKLLSYRIAD